MSSNRLMYDTCDTDTPRMKALAVLAYNLDPSDTKTVINAEWI